MRVFDSSGNEYSMKSIFLGKREGGFTDSVVQGIPMKSGLTFEIPSNVWEFTLLEIPYNYGNLTGFPAKLQFRNVKITPSKASETNR